MRENERKREREREKEREGMRERKHFAKKFLLNRNLVFVQLGFTLQRKKVGKYFRLLTIKNS